MVGAPGGVSTTRLLAGHERSCSSGSGRATFPVHLDAKASQRQDDRDKALMARIARADHDAFRELVLRHQDRVFALAYRFLGNQADAEEVAQDSFARLFEAAPRYRPEASFSTYLLRITTNLCINRKSRAYRQREESREPSAVDESQRDAESRDPRAELLREERARAVREAVQALPEDQRAALILFRFEGLSYEEIAKATGKSVSAVTSLLWRARAALRDSLRDWLDPSTSQESQPSPVRK